MLSNNQTLKYLLRAKYMACLFIFFHVLSYATSSSFSSDTLHEGASLSVRKPDDVLVSSNGVFSAGFHYVGQNRYCFAIWFNLPPYNYSYANRTVVWMANRDKPVNNGKHSKLSLQKDGNLVLNDDRRLIVWATDTVSVSSTFLHLLDTGNLVLKDYFKVDVVLWQSFHSSTDTLLPLQPLTKSTKLISSRSQSNFSTVGRSTSNDSKIAMLNSLGNFTSSDGFRFLSTDYGSNMIQRRLRMDDDGNLRLYSRKIDGIGWYVSWQAILDPCMINGICGINGICTNDPSSGRSCSCFPGHKMKDPSDWTEGEIEDKRSLVSWVRKNIEETSSDEIVVLLEKIVDPSLGEEYDLKEMEKLLEVAMKCVEVERGARPTMRQVVEMLLD
ncbi:hypothetical protein FEM48_Zijuj02G0103300 [Ziziphus jujuba var. spinosa]|uniref:Bulb-type lectin domain-containing protein n=1 Tax=Ziziphus jujuba var. spinosa TaxID=714518 RepID=A0A978VV67_ZIZJJ|nr:hypothetical protein FEM48_Zijuj02G0103300 [Ziziphus jujuba var. spinosa]